MNYQKFINRIIKFKMKIDEFNLFKHSTIIFLSIILSSLFAYIFHISMARVLEPADYSIIGVSTAIFYMVAYSISSIQIVISKLIMRSRIT